MVPDALFSNCWRVSYKTENHLVRVDENVSAVQDINAGKPQRSVLGLLLFLINVNDIRDIQHESSQNAVFEDDCSILTSHQHNRFLTHEKQLNQISKWLSANEFLLNFEKIFYLMFGRTKSMRKTLRISEKVLKTESSFIYLGIFFDSDLTFRKPRFVLV